ncbi:hypothetical protein BAUCODRAFT_152392 [Baudoinia panamericana UAMH 10762]|uniref:DUF1772 domain-containing protein n=1 Tax=Baudoinia panamericana (strain UAMH 10762) TaxID=717646 RepID=M2MIJ6_BAUPA|nr:uncharacterized protein BAUCODRAFT_152392 [Baudoinia panamericana UAMH 10762]EMC91098.1 hypothetical protein BAUCODRAFT_152392 [Baudoinia panamericana UAMH 10762]
MASATTAAQVVSVSVALLASGGIATLSLFDIPEFQSQPASRALPMTRWLFSRGSHMFPQAAMVSSAGFAYLAYKALPAGPLAQAFQAALTGVKLPGYLAASALTFAIAPFTIIFMKETNFTLIKKNAELGGARSAKSAEQNGPQLAQRSAEDSIYGKGEADEFSDLSVPQGKTKQSSSAEDDERVRKLLGDFALLNNVRAVLMGAGGIAGLWTALA